MGCCAGVSQNQDPYTMQKDVGVEALNQATVVGSRIKHSENSDQKSGAERQVAEKRRAPNIELKPLPLAKQEEFCLEGSTGASKNIQIQNSESTEATPEEKVEEQKGEDSNEISEG